MGACRPSFLASPTHQVNRETRGSAFESAPGAVDPELQRLATAITRRRGGEVLRAPCLIELPREALVRAALADTREPESLRDARNEILQRLELVPATFDWLDAVRRSLETSLLGFYAARRHCIFLDARLRGATRRRTLAHELVHALQTQRFGFNRQLEYRDGGWDQRAAAHALAEADAEALVNDLPELAGSEALSDPLTVPAETADLPGVLVRSASAAYLDGRARVEDALAFGGWPEVDRLLASPPESTHALLHPGDSTPPVELSPPPALELGVRLRHTDVLGEQALRIVLEAWLPVASAERLASGWRADRLSLFEGPGVVVTRWQLSLAAPEVARAVAAAFQSGLQLPALAEPKAGPGSVSCREHRDEGAIGLVVGDRVSLAFLSLRRGNAPACPELEAWAQGGLESRNGPGNPGRR